MAIAHRAVYLVRQCGDLAAGLAHARLGITGLHVGHGGTESVHCCVGSDHGGTYLRRHDCQHMLDCLEPADRFAELNTLTCVGERAFENPFHRARHLLATRKRTKSEKCSGVVAVTGKLKQAFVYRKSLELDAITRLAGDVQGRADAAGLRGNIYNCLAAIFKFDN